jgi:hypothetical protein
MLEIEGLTYENINDTIKAWKPILFKKVTMKVVGNEDNGKLSLLTSDFSDEYIGNGNLTMIDIGIKE